MSDMPPVPLRIRYGAAIMLRDLLATLAAGQALTPGQREAARTVILPAVEAGIVEITTAHQTEEE